MRSDMSAVTGGWSSATGTPKTGGVLPRAMSMMSETQDEAVALAADGRGGVSDRMAAAARMEARKKRRR